MKIGAVIADTGITKTRGVVADDKAARAHAFNTRTPAPRNPKAAKAVKRGRGHLQLSFISLSLGKERKWLALYTLQK